MTQAMDLLIRVANKIKVNTADLWAMLPNYTVVVSVIAVDKKEDEVTDLIVRQLELFTRR